MNASGGLVNASGGLPPAKGAPGVRVKAPDVEHKGKGSNSGGKPQVSCVDTAQGPPPSRVLRSGTSHVGGGAEAGAQLAPGSVTGDPQLPVSPVDFARPRCESRSSFSPHGKLRQGEKRGVGDRRSGRDAGEVTGRKTRAVGCATIPEDHVPIVTPDEAKAISGPGQAE